MRCAFHRLFVCLEGDYVSFISQNQRDEIQRKFDALRDSCSVSKAAFLLSSNARPVLSNSNVFSTRGMADIHFISKWWDLLGFWMSVKLILKMYGY